MTLGSKRPAPPQLVWGGHSAGEAPAWAWHSQSQVLARGRAVALSQPCCCSEAVAKELLVELWGAE